MSLGTMSIVRYKTRFWAVYDGAGDLVCVCVYRKGAKEVVRRFETLETAERSAA